MKNSGYHLPESSGHWHGWLGTASYSGAGLNGGRTFTNILPLKNGETMIGHDKHNINRLMETQRPISKPYCWFTEQRLWGPRWPKRSRHQTAAGWFFSSSCFFSSHEHHPIDEKIPNPTIGLQENYRNPSTIGQYRRSTGHGFLSDNLFKQPSELSIAMLCCRLVPSSPKGTARGRCQTKDVWIGCNKETL